MSEGDHAASSSSEGSGRLQPPQAEQGHKTRPPCKFFLTRRGCSQGSECKFSHVIREKGAGEEQRSWRSSKPPVCRQFLTTSGCRYGDRCRYRHVARELGGGVDEALSEGVQQVSLEGAGGGGREGEDSAHLLDLTSFPGLGSAGSAGSVQQTQPVPFSQPHPSPPHTSHPHKHHSSHSSKRHAPTELSLGSFMTTPTVSAVAGATRSHPPIERPQRTNKKTAVELRQAELEQLETRFHGNHSLVEKGKERSVYRVTFAPTDPDWNFKFSTIDLEVAFPKDYPTVPLSLTLPNDQGLHPIYITHGNQAVSRYLATAPGGSGELMFRPFIRWFDKTITSVFKDAAKQVTAELFARGSGGDETTPTEDHTPSASEEDEESMESSGEEEGDEEGDEQSDQGSDNQEELPAAVQADNKRGTEMRLSGLVMSDGVGVGRCASVRITLQCTRCRAQHDYSTKAECPSSEVCSQCQSCYSFSYRPSLFHPTSSTLGFLDLQGCQPVDLILMQCEATLTCLECGRDNTTSGLNYGEHRDTWCKRCHMKLSLTVEQCRFIQHQPGLLPAAVSDGRKKRSERKKKKDALIQVGKPLPEFGTCAHYKKSNRWLRFPCCGKPFPCDACHDETEDHVMERASRMICGFCCREQTYSSSRPCVGCGSDLVGGRPGAYWEGGKGCRNKVKMSRNDIHKYANSGDKTKCKKQERVGKQPTPTKH